MLKRSKSFFPYVLLAVTVLLAMYVFLNRIGVDNHLKAIKSAPEFTLPDLDGHAINSSAWLGDVTLLEFIFTSCPDICPATTYNMVQIQEKLKERGLFANKVKMVAITFDPDRDTPEVFRKYADRLKLDPSGWFLLRGDKSLTQNIMRAYGVTIEDLGEGNFVHSSTSLFLIDSKNAIRQIYQMGSDMNNEQILADIVKLTGMIA